MDGIMALTDGGMRAQAPSSSKVGFCAAELPNLDLHTRASPGFPAHVTYPRAMIDPALTVGLVHRISTICHGSGIFG